MLKGYWPLMVGTHLVMQQHTHQVYIYSESYSFLQDGHTIIYGFHENKQIPAASAVFMCLVDL